MTLHRLRRITFRDFLRNTDGTISVEFILWVPILFFFWFIALQVSFLFVVQSNFWNAAAETARLVARHGLDAQTAVPYAQNVSSIFGISPDAAVSIVDDVVNVTISIPALEITALNPLKLNSDFTIAASINYTLEPL